MKIFKKLQKSPKNNNKKNTNNRNNNNNKKMRLQWFHSIRTKLMAAVLVMIIPIVFLGLFSYNRAYKSIRQTAEESTFQIMEQLGKYLTLSFSGIESDCNQIIMNTDFIKSVTASEDVVNYQLDLTEFMSSIKQENALIDDIIVLLEGKKPLSASFRKVNKSALENIKDGQLFNMAKEKDGLSFWVGSLYELDDQISDMASYAMALARLIKNPYTSEIEGIIVITVKQNLVANALKDVQLGNGSELHLISPDGKDIAYTMSDGVSQELDTSVPENQVVGTALYSEIVSNETGKGSDVTRYRDGEYLAVYCAIGESGFNLVGLTPTSIFSAKAADIRNITLLLTVLVSAFAVVVGILMAGGISRAVNHVLQISKQVSEGDLTVRFDHGRKNEFGTLAKAFNVVIENMRSMIGNVTQSANNVNESAGIIASTAKEAAVVSREVAKAVEEIAAGAADQAGEAEQCNKKMGDLEEKINAVSEYANEIGAYTSETIRLTKQGLAAVENLEGASRETTEITQGIISDIQALDKNSQSIGSIIAVIDQIADQTNLLALNAAIEAARAGEHGKGFAVVSEEVRKLAEDSSRETKAIANLVSSIRQAIQRAVAASEVGAQEVETGSILAQEASAALAEIAEGAVETERLVLELSEASTIVSQASASVQEVMKRVVELAEENASSAVTMMSSANEVRRLIDSVAAVSEESAAATEEVSASSLEMQGSIQRVYESAQTLAELARSLKDMVNKFKLE